MGFGRPIERLGFRYDRHEEITRYVRLRRGVSNTAKLHTRLHNLYKITPGLHRDYTYL